MFRRQNPGIPSGLFFIYDLILIFGAGSLQGPGVPNLWKKVFWMVAAWHHPSADVSAASPGVSVGNFACVFLAKFFSSLLLSFSLVVFFRRCRKRRAFGKRYSG